MKNYSIHNVSCEAQNAVNWTATKKILADKFFQILNEASAEGADRVIFQIPMVLRAQNFNPFVVETALLESYLAQLLLDSENALKHSDELTRPNTTLITVVVNNPHSFLNNEPGLFCLWKFNSQICAMKIDPEIAEILDDAIEGNLKMLKQHKLSNQSLFSFLQECGILV